MRRLEFYKRQDGRLVRDVHLQLPKDLWSRIRVLAVQRETTATALVEAALRAFLKETL